MCTKILSYGVPPITLFRGLVLLWTVKGIPVRQRIMIGDLSRRSPSGYYEPPAAKTECSSL